MLMANAFNMDPNGNGKRGVSRFNDVSRQRQDSDGEPESADLEFIYDDADSYTNEMAEFYSYSEQPEYQLNLKAFEDLMELYKIKPSWQKLNTTEKKLTITKLLNQLELSSKNLRMQAARCFLYLVQGCWAEAQSDKEQQAYTKENVLLIYECGVFHSFIELLNIEIDNTTAASNAMRKLNICLGDSVDLRTILGVIYTVVEVMRTIQDEDTEHWKNARDSFRNDLLNPIGGELFSMKLFGMVTRYCVGVCPHYPIKKIVLLLWKLLLFTFGGTSVLRELKNKYRIENGLLPVEEDTMEIAQTLRASSLPASAADSESQNQKRNVRPLRRSLMKQSSLDEPPLGIDFEQNDEELRDYDESHVVNDPDMPQPPSPRSMTTPTPIKGLPWSPKVRLKDLDLFLENSRLKFVGYALQGDRDSLIGLPQPIHEGVHVFKRYIYHSLSEVQMEKEETAWKSPVSAPVDELPNTPVEVLYKAILPVLPNHVIAILKILLAASPTAKQKSDSINVMSDVLPEEMPMTVSQSMMLSTDVNRHKEIIVKAISAIVLLLIKHFKLNHIYQFEYLSQHLVFANCVPLCLKFFNQNIVSYVQAKNSIPILDFPACVLGDQPELTIESLEIGEDNQQSTWRNVFTCINLLRILNKLTKWKHSRIMMLIVFKAAPILKRTLKVRHGMMQLFVLKLLKMQAKFLGRQWRKSNMKTISAIYQKVRHHLNDDWAYGNEMDARPWDFQADECGLKNAVDRFNARRYALANIEPPVVDFDPVDTNIMSVLGSYNTELTDEFKQHYDEWLQREVFQSNVNWDEIVNYGYL